MSRVKSIMSNVPVCLICKAEYPLHRHHVYGGHGRREKSERYGCWVYLCPKHHNMSAQGVHFNKKLDTWLKRECQARWEKQYGDRDKFIEEFGRSYL